MSRSVDYKAPKPIIKGEWKAPVICPGCGLATDEHKTRPRWRCQDDRCSFRNGFTLEPAADKTIRAVPLSDAGVSDWAGSVIWPRQTNDKILASIAEAEATKESIES